MKVILFGISCLLLTSCFLFREYKRTTFTYSAAGQAASIPIIVPKGYLKHEKVDTAGVTLHSYYYTGGAILYTAYAADTTIELLPINKKVHQPLQHRLGGTVYKGQDEAELFYREIKRGPFRFGYRFVPEAFELQFDSATNFASLQKR